jgi:hypothetical protein
VHSHAVDPAASAARLRPPQAAAFPAGEGSPSKAEWPAFERFARSKGRRFAALAWREFALKRPLELVSREYRRKLNLHSWAAIIDTLMDPHIVKITYASGGHQDGLIRIDLTGIFFASVFHWRKHVDHVIRDINERHVNTGVARRQIRGVDDFVYRVNDPYRDSFNYIAAALVHEALRGCVELGIEKDSPAFGECAQALIDLWYQAATRAVGGVAMPATFEEHEAFRARHEADIFAASPDKAEIRRKGHEIALGFVPWIAWDAGLSSARYVDAYLRREVAVELKLLDVDWEAIEADARDRHRALRRVSRSVAGVWDAATKGPQRLLKNASLASRDPVVRALSDFSRGHRGFRPRVWRIRQREQDATTLIAKGQPVEEMYVTIDDHPVEVQIDPRAAPHVIVDPSVYGEIGLQTGNPASADVRVRGKDPIVVVITRAQFDELLRHKAFRIAVIRQKRERLRRDARTMEYHAALAKARGDIRDFTQEVKTSLERTGDAAVPTLHAAVNDEVLRGMIEEYQEQFPDEEAVDFT